MRNRMAVLALIVMTGVGFVVGLLVESRMQRVQAQARPESAFPAIPGQKGGEDITGPYEPVADWPKPLTSLPGHENWTWGAVEGIFAESPDRMISFKCGRAKHHPGSHLAIGVSDDRSWVLTWRPQASSVRPKRK